MLLPYPSRRQFRAVLDIISRNVFLLVNGIIFVVVTLLIISGDVREGIFLGFITVLNIVLGVVQEINAWLALEKLQLLAAPKVTRINKDNTESIILAEEIRQKDRIKLKTGDQAPCDGILVLSHGLGVTEGLITGESAEFLRKPGDRVLAGSIVTSGLGVLEVEKVFAESRIALMTKSIKKYSLVLSPIQYSINLIIKYMGYALLLIILFVAGRGFLIHESTINIIQTVGALTSDLLPQGVILFVTLLFSYGAIYLYRRNVLLQDINAIEKIARIKNLCVDKTGTLTDNNLVAERLYSAPGVNKECVTESITAYIASSGSPSRTGGAVKKMFAGDYSGVIVDFLDFSSSRQFGAVHVKDDFGERVVLAGAPDVFLSHLLTVDEREWTQQYIDTEARIGKRLICFVQSDSRELPHDLSGVKLSVIAVVVLNNGLREGIREAISFFQDRDAIIRIISGDGPETVCAVAAAAGVNNPYAVITGTELESWTEADFLRKIPEYTVFARVKPEQKEKIVEILRQSGFTAMIGDGANDALAIKKADLGIAMFDGAQATRQIASVVLVKNSFSDLPNGVKLADSIIQNIKIGASLFFNTVFLGLLFYIILTAAGYLFPFTPLNFTFINYFVIGLPGFLIFYWIVRPIHTHIARDDKSFLRQVLPFAFVSAIPQAILAALAFYSGLDDVKGYELTSLALLAFIIFGFVFFVCAPIVYSGPPTRTQKKQFALLAVIETILVAVLIRVPLVETFYNLKIPSLHSIVETIPFIVIYVLIQYGLVRWLFAKQVSNSNEAVASG